MDRPRTSYAHLKIERSISEQYRVRRSSNSQTIGTSVENTTRLPGAFWNPMEDRKMSRHSSFRLANAPSWIRRQGVSSPGTEASNQQVFPGYGTRRSRAIQAIFGHHNREEGCAVDDQECDVGKSSKSRNWLRRAASVTFRRKSRSSRSHEQPDLSNVLGIDTVSPLDHGLKNPIVRVSPVGGVAARAAAAAQNEIFESTRPFYSEDSTASKDSRAMTDSESGIGIEIRRQCSRDSNLDDSIPRIDPASVLPEELFTHVILNLDPWSLIRAELVSKSWQKTTNSHSVWREMFRRCYLPTTMANERSDPLPLEGALGLGRNKPDQDWKAMWRVRKALEARWRTGQAAAIYLEGHRDTVYCVQFDGHKILTGSRDRTIRVWDAHTYQCLRVLGLPKSSGSYELSPPLINRTTRGHKPLASIVPADTVPSLPWTPVHQSLCHTGSILCLQFDRKMMVTGSSDMTLVIWDVANDYQPINRLRNHSAGVLDVCFDSKHIVSCSKDTTICVWDRESGQVLRTLTGHRGPVNAVQLRDELLVSASGDGIAKLWNLLSGSCAKEFSSEFRGLACVEFSPDSRTVYAGGNDQIIYQFDAITGELVRQLKGHGKLVRSLHLDSINRRIISGSYDYSVHAYDADSGDMMCDFAGWTTSWMLSAKADYRRIVATSQDKRVVIMDFGHDLPGIDLLEG